MERKVGTVSRGIRGPIIREGDNVSKIQNAERRKQRHVKRCISHELTNIEDISRSGEHRSRCAILQEGIVSQVHDEAVLISDIECLACGHYVIIGKTVKASSEV